jgi:glutamate--cysteine ligase
VELQSMILLDTLDELTLRRGAEVDAWFDRQESGKVPPFYASVDIRNAGYKLAVVDTNLFPAGFNNLCDYSYRLGADQVRAYFANHFPQVRRILIVPESNTRNPGYTANIARLESLIEKAGFEVAVGTLIESVPSAGVELLGLEDLKVRLHPFQVTDGIPSINGKPFDAVLLNHDLSGGEPGVLKQITVPVIPRRVLGWHKRRKSMHFAHLTAKAAEFATAFNIDPWQMTAETESVDGVTFEPNDTLLRGAVDRIFAKTQKAYLERGIEEKPYVFIKHDAGTYGIGVMAIHDPAELDFFSRDVRKKMKTGKGGVAITDVIVQEGLPTTDRIRGSAGEPVIYSMNNRIIGGFFRMHSEADDRASLNKPGQVYARLCSTPTKEQSRSEKCYHDSRLFRSYGILSRLAGLAVMAETDELERE